MQTTETKREKEKRKAKLWLTCRSWTGMVVPSLLGMPATSDFLFFLFVFLLSSSLLLSLSNSLFLYIFLYVFCICQIILVFHSYCHLDVPKIVSCLRMWGCQLVILTIVQFEFLFQTNLPCLRRWMLQSFYMGLSRCRQSGSPSKGVGIPQRKGVNIQPYHQHRGLFVQVLNIPVPWVIRLFSTWILCTRTNVN